MAEPTAEPDFYSGIKSSDNTYMGREEVFSLLEKNRIELAVVEFSGGHDEGGADDIYLERGEAGGRVAELREHIFPHLKDAEGNWLYDEHEHIDPSGQSRPVRRPRERELTVEEKNEMRLAQSLAAPVYDSYYGFAGDFHVSGRVEWMVGARRVVMDGQESVESYEDFEKEF